jgi:hypothetical protein
MNALNQTMKDDEADKPLDPATEKVRRKMVRLLAVSIGIMFVGLMAVLGAIVYKFSQPGNKVTAQAEAVSVPQSLEEITGTVALPTGAQINATSLSGNRVLFDVSMPDGKRDLLIWDIAAGRFAAKLSLTNVNQ